MLAHCYATAVPLQSQPRPVAPFAQLDFCNTAEAGGANPMSLAGLDPEMYYRDGHLRIGSYPVASMCAAAVRVWL